MKYFFCLIILLFIVIISDAQTPQFAVVRPNGVTYICPSFDSAYNKSVDGDFLYLPGGMFTITNPINKNLQIYGAGFNQDSSFVTGNTIITSSIFVNRGGSNGTLTGVYCYNTIYINDTVNNYAINRCWFLGSIYCNASSASPASNINIIEIYIKYYV